MRRKNIRLNLVKDKLAQVLADSSKGTVYRIRDGKGLDVAILPYDELDSLIETVNVMEEFPDIHREIQEAQEDIAKGNYYTLEDSLDGVYYKKVQSSGPDSGSQRVKKKTRRNSKKIS